MTARIRNARTHWQKTVKNIGLWIIPLLLLGKLSAAESVTTLVPDYWPTEGWRTSAPEQQGMNSEKLAELFGYINEQDWPIDSLLIIRNGYIVTEAYFYPFQQGMTHAIHSVTKIFTSATFGIALEKGYIGDLDARIVDFFPHHSMANRDSRKNAIALRHLLTMSAGW
jgi:hypothetical protein